MSDRANFLRAIIANPADDLPRRHYADICEAEGEYDRAEFIRVQCELAGVRGYGHEPRKPSRPGDCHRTRPGWAEYQAALKTYRAARKAWTERRSRVNALRRRERALLGSACLWLPPGVVWSHCEGPPIERPTEEPTGYFRRGFVEEVACTWEDFARHADAIRQATPLRKVRLTTVPSLYESNYETHHFYRLNVAGQRGRMDHVLTTEERRHFDGDYRRFVTERLLAAEFPGVEFELPPPITEWWRVGPDDLLDDSLLPPGVERTPDGRYIVRADIPLLNPRRSFVLTTGTS